MLAEVSTKRGTHAKKWPMMKVLTIMLRVFLRIRREMR